MASYSVDRSRVEPALDSYRSKLECGQFTARQHNVIKISSALLLVCWLAATRCGTRLRTEPLVTKQHSERVDA